MLGHITDAGVPGGLTLGELAEPEAGRDEMVIDVRAYGLNRGELSLLEMRSDGWTPGQDVAGIVVRSAATGGPPEGSRVVGVADAGGWSERVAVPVHRAAPLPSEVSFREAAALPVAGLTALRALRVGGSLLGRRVLVTGASGGVGSIAVQLASIGGAAATALVSRPERIATPQELGAGRVVTSLEGEGPFDVVLDGVGGNVLVEGIRRLSRTGVAIAYGLAGGEPSRLSFRDFVDAPFARLVPFWVYTTDQQTFGEDLAVLARVVADGRLRIVVGAAFDWQRTLEGIKRLRARDIVGKVVFERSP